jgi:hypothetical protein
MFEAMPEGARRVLRVIVKNPPEHEFRMKDLRFALAAVEIEIERCEAFLAKNPERRVPIASELVQFRSYRNDIVAIMRRHTVRDGERRSFVRPMVGP